MLSSLSAANDHTCVVRDSTVWCTGANSLGQLGTGDTTRSIAFIPSLLTNAAMVDVGGSTTCAVKTDSTVWCWGIVPTASVSADGQPVVDFLPSRIPVQVAITDVRTVAVGGSHACAVKTDGSVWCWGKNSIGQLGDGSTIASVVPVPARVNPVSSIDAGPSHTCAVTTNASVWCWGSNGSHRLGQRSGGRRTTPTLVRSVRARKVATGGAFTCAITTAGGVKCWGRNNYGQLGKRAGASRISPYTTSLKRVRSLSAGTEFICATTSSRATSTLASWCWGRNRDGQLANGSNKFRHVPQRISTPAEVGTLSSVSAGSSHACALAVVVGAMWCWGRGTQGQLGDGAAVVRRRGVAIWPNGVQMTPIGDDSRATVTAAGDIACDASRRATYGEGPSGLQCGDASTASLIEALNPDAVIALGDLQYENADIGTFRSQYANTWGRLVSRTYPIRGNHEYLTSGAAGYVSYFGAMSPSYWWADMGGWRLIAVDSWCLGQLFAGCDTDAPQTTWLQAQLRRARDDGKCAAVVMHHPIVSSGRHGTESVGDLWSTIVTEGADVVLAAHDHVYERFEPLGVDGLPSQTGVPLFISGLGGTQAHAFTETAAGSAARANSDHGVLAMTFTPTSYEWRFVSASDGTALDSGSRSCTT